MHIKIPQCILLFLMVVDLIIGLVRHGEDREPYNGHYFILGFALQMLLLLKGGFFE